MEVLCPPGRGIDSIGSEGRDALRVDILNLETIFQKQGRYEIPAFQRQYIWSQDTQLEPLWEDVRNTAEQYLESAKIGDHFLGAVVLQEQSTMTADALDRRIVVDGQQRLTTLQLLLAAVQEELELRGHPAAERLALLVGNHTAFCGDDPDNAFKVWPTTLDQDAFRHAMGGDQGEDEYEGSRIAEAHGFFKTQVQQWLDAHPEEAGTRAGALERVISGKLAIVVIDLDQGDNPHIIFETLNARGTPLLQSDLIKNMVLFEATNSGIALRPEEAAQLWAFDDGWWREETGYGRNARLRIEAFLNYWLTMRTRGEVAPATLFSEFRRYAEGRPIDTVAADISRIGSIYRSLEEVDDADLEAFNYRRGVMQVGVLTPALLWLLSSQVQKGQLRAALLALESYLIRRMVCRMSTRGYINLFIGLVIALEEGGPACAGDHTVDYLHRQSGDAGQWPDDRQFQEAFVSLPLFWLLTRGRLRIVLEGIEEQLRTDMAESGEATRGLTIEHIMPQSWREKWPLALDAEDESEVADHRDHIIHSIGNLTLVSGRLNPSLSNAPWREKRKTLQKHSTLFLNKGLFLEAPEEWDEVAIEARGKRLCQLARKVWPYAEGMSGRQETDPDS